MNNAEYIFGKFKEMFPLLAKEVAWYSVSKDPKNTLLLYSEMSTNRKGALVYKFTYTNDTKWCIERV